MKRPAVIGAILIFGVLLIACSGDDIFPLGSKSAVRFTLDENSCLVRADDFDSVNTSIDGNSGTRTFSWICTDYKGLENVHVSLTFDNSGDGSQCLKLSEEVISDGICA